MKNFFFIVALLFSFPLLAQDQGETVVFSGALQPGEILSFENKEIKFKEVVSDSRCPKGVTCLWAGEANVLIEILQKGELIEEKIITISSPEIPLNLSSGDYSYSLNSLQLLPYPSAGKKPANENYTLMMSVCKKI